MPINPKALILTSTLQALVDANQQLLSEKSKKGHDSLFSAIRNGDFDMDDYEELMAPTSKLPSSTGGCSCLIQLLSERKKKFKDTGLPDELQDQWEQDRAKKAENKQKRNLARVVAAADPQTKKKGGKKGLKAMIAAARLEEEGPIELPNRIVDLATLEQQIRRFLRDLDTPTMTLPPCSKETRKNIHKLANAFSLKSVSKGHGNARYTTLTKTSRSGTNIREGKVKSILRSGGGTWDGPGGGRANATSLAKHREGEEVGKVRSLVCVMSRCAAATYRAHPRLHRRLERTISASSCWPLWAGRKGSALVCREA